MTPSQPLPCRFDPEYGRVVRRDLFRDVEGGYDEVEGVSSMGFRLGGFPVASHTMENAAELGVILMVLLVGAPLIKRLSSE